MMIALMMILMMIIVLFVMMHRTFEDGVSPPSGLEVAHDEDVGDEVDHVLFAAAVWHLQKRVDVAHRRSHHVTNHWTNEGANMCLCCVRIKKKSAYIKCIVLKIRIFVFMYS